MSRALNGIRVLDLSRILAGPYCTMILGDLGAEIIKVERSKVGDDLRRWGPPFTDDGESVYFLAVGRNKRSITADFKHPAGAEMVRALAEKSDVLIENYRTGTLDELGLGYKELHRRNPRLVYCSITGYGSNGPMKDEPGFDVVIQAMGGLMSITGEPDGRPMKVGVAAVDIITGLYSAIGILSALRSRDVSGEGQRVEISLLDAELAALVNVAAGWLIAGQEPVRLGNAHPNAGPYEVFATKDGHVAIAIGSDVQWQRLCAALAQPELAVEERYATNRGRLNNRAELTARLDALFATRTSQEWLETLRAAEIPVGPINTIPQILAHPQVTERGVVKTVEHPTAGQLKMIASPLRMSRDSTDPRLAPPLLGADTDAVLRELLGYDDARIAELRREGAV
ncbi:MAG: CoA transferase [Chloroflexi bacterium]|nr:CoA transferase [Chloroflexota bacterium]